MLYVIPADYGGDNMNAAETMTKMAMLPRILEAANLLKNLGLIDTEPNELIKKYVGENPDINETFSKMGKELESQSNQGLKNGTEIEKKVHNIVVDTLGAENYEVVPSAHFVNDLDADSLDTVELCMAFEDEFKIEILDEDAEKMHTVQHVLDYLNNNVESTR
jgi:acyl carrier protein